jgi:hypothetical protein
LSSTKSQIDDAGKATTELPAAMSRFSQNFVNILSLAWWKDWAGADPRL